MKVFFLYHTVNTPFGGANQFIRALKNFFKQHHVLTNNLLAADIIFLNSHVLGGTHGTIFQIAYVLKALFPQKIFVQRLDGPIQLYGGPRRATTDQAIYRLNEALVDGTIFQSQWSREHNQLLGMQSSPYVITIPNAPDSSFFFPSTPQSSAGHIRLIATSWSSHVNKGFDIYEYLDEHLDWSRFTMTFVGRTSRRFKNIIIREPVASSELGELLRAHDIYVTASKNDPCSNALLEALACGLPAVARSSGGHPELVGQGGKLFMDGTGAIAAIEAVAQNLDHYRRGVTIKSMTDIGSHYIAFCQQILSDQTRGDYTPKRVSFPSLLRQVVNR